MAWCRMRRRNVNILATPIPVNKVDHVPENISQSSARTQAPIAYHESVDQNTSPPLIQESSIPFEPNSSRPNKCKQALEIEISLQKYHRLQFRIICSERLREIDPRSGACQQNRSSERHLRQFNGRPLTDCSNTDSATDGLLEH